jgi:beta-galactosidase
VELCLDGRQSGVGGYDSWGATAEKERTLWSNRDYSFSFLMEPLR